MLRRSLVKVRTVSFLGFALTGMGCGNDGASTSSTDEPGSSTSTSDGETSIDPSLTTSISATDPSSPTSESSSTDEGSSQGSESTSTETGPTSVCGNGVIEGDEVCDGAAVGEETCISLGFESGELACTEDCSALETASCAVCGNDAIDGTDVCDGIDVGEASCATLGLGEGTLACLATCSSFDVSGCTLGGTAFGSDAFYSGFEATPPVLPCDDIGATGTALDLDDDDAAAVPIGFTFTFYGSAFTTASVQSNGAIALGTNLVHDYINACIPADSAIDDNLIEVFWDDLFPPGGSVSTQTLGTPGVRRFVVQWDVAPLSGNDLDPFRLQAMLLEGTNQIFVCYADTTSAASSSNGGASATAGLQRNVSGGLQYSCNTPDLTAGLFLRYAPN